MVNCIDGYCLFYRKQRSSPLGQQTSLSSTGDMGFVLVRRQSGEGKRALPNLCRIP